MYRLLFAIVISALFTWANPHIAQADNLESTQYRIEFGNVNLGAKSQTSTSYNLDTTIGQTAFGQFDSTGYVIKAGFQYIHSIIPFRFSLSSTNINLGALSPNSPSTATTNLTVTFGGAGAYQVTGIEETPLQTQTGSQIPDTSCDTSCDETTAGQWISSSAYGFGYNMYGLDIPATFSSTDYYRPFPDRSAAESPALIMTNSNVGTGRTATMTFKANISSVQPGGSYQTVINFVATPSY